MNNRQHITVLIVNAEAEEVKMITLCFRTVFPGCRVEAIYSADDVLDWVSKHDWQVVFLDEPLLQSGGTSIIPEIRKRLPKSAIILQTDRNDISTAMGGHPASRASRFSHPCRQLVRSHLRALR